MSAGPHSPFLKAVPFAASGLEPTPQDQVPWTGVVIWRRVRMFLSPRPQSSEFGRVFRLRRLTLGCLVIQFLIGEVERTDFHESHGIFSQ